MPNGRVLVVEDEEDLRQVMMDTLGAAGYGVAQAANGKEALEVLRDGAAPDVILLDLMMPVMDGWELLGALKDDARLTAIPVVVATAFARNVPAGVRCVLKKPFTIADLVSCVGQCVQRGRSAS